MPRKLCPCGLCKRCRERLRKQGLAECLPPGPVPSCTCGRCRKCKHRLARSRRYHYLKEIATQTVSNPRVRPEDHRMKIPGTSPQPGPTEEDLERRAIESWNPAWGPPNIKADGF